MYIQNSSVNVEKKVIQWALWNDLLLFVVVIVGVVVTHLCFYKGTIISCINACFYTLEHHIYEMFPTQNDTTPPWIYLRIHSHREKATTTKHISELAFALKVKIEESVTIHSHG